MEKRGCNVFISFMCIFSILFLRCSISILNNKYITAGVNQATYNLQFSKTRGEIYDRNNIPLVEEKREIILAINPTKENEQAIKNSNVIIQKGDLNAKYALGKPFVKTATAKVNIPQVECFETSKRYSENQIAQHLIGYVNGDNVGVSGIEKAYEKELSRNSQFSKIKYTLDALGKNIPQVEPVAELAPFLKEGVVLTIDKKIQKMCEEVGARKLKKGAIVVMNAENSELLSVASFPNYNANNLDKAFKEGKDAPLINRAFSAFNVGSVFKPVTAAAGLTNGMTKDYKYCCTGKFDIAKNSFGCHKKDGHATLDLKGAMVNSCNPYFIDFSKDISAKKMLIMASDLSFGKRTLLCKNLYTEAGNLPSLTEISSPAGKANFSFGQGSLTATPIQIAQMMTTIVTGGEAKKPSLVRGYFNGEKLVKEQQSYPIKAMEKPIADELTEELRASVNDIANQNAKSNFVTCGGKTGTAQTGRIINGEEALNGWFAGFSYDKKYEAGEKINEKPKYVIVVLSENCQSGNADSSPIFREIVDKLVLY